MTVDRRYPGQEWESQHDKAHKEDGGEEQRDSDDDTHRQTSFVEFEYI